MVMAPSSAPSQTGWKPGDPPNNPEQMAINERLEAEREAASQQQVATSASGTTIATAARSRRATRQTGRPTKRACVITTAGAGARARQPTPTLRHEAEERTNDIAGHVPIRTAFASRNRAGDDWHVSEWSAPKGKAHPPCCRLDTSVGLLVREEEPLCRSMGSEPEVYRFIWHSSFDGDAMVRIGRQDENVMLRWWYRPFILIDEPAHDTAAAPADWARFQAQISAVGFWSLAPMDDHQG
jgi:hypothetical protein